MTKLLILVSIVLAYFSSNALAYLKDYPPYKFEDGPSDHLQVQTLTDSTKSEYVSSDRKISASLKKTKSGIELLVKDNGIVVVSKKASKFPVPYAVYHTDIDGDGLNDFIVFYNYRDWFRNGIKEDRVEIFLKQSEGTYQKIAYDAISVGLEDFVDLNGDGKYEVIIAKMDRIKGHNYFIYNIYEFDGFRLLNSDAKFKGFSKFIRYFLRPNDNDDLNISRKERLALSASNDKAVQRAVMISEKAPAVIKPKEFVGIEAGELSKKLAQENEAIKALENNLQKLMSQAEDSERKFQKSLISERNNQKILDVRIEELADKLVIFERNMKVLEEENRNLQSVIETRKTEFQEAIASKDMKHQESLMTTIKELSERLVLNADSIMALKDKDLELESQFQGKEVEFQKVIAAKDKEQRDGLEDRVGELSDKLVVLEKNMKIREEENRNLKSRLETRENDLQEALLIKDRSQKETISNRFMELFDRFALLEKNMNGLEEDGQIMQGKLETKVEELAEALALKDKTIEELKDGEQGLKVEVENSKLELKKALDDKEKEYQKVLETRFEGLSEKLSFYDMTIQALKEENHNIQSRFEAKEAEIEEISVAQDKQREEVLESRILALEDKERELRTNFEDKEIQLEEAFADMNKKHQETMEVTVEELSGKLAVFNKHLNALEEEGRNINSRLEARENELREGLVVKDMDHKEAINNRFMEFSGRLAAFEKNMKGLESENQSLQSRLEENERTFQDLLSVKDREYQTLSDNNDAKLLDVNKKLALKDEVIKELEEKEEQLRSQFEGKEEGRQQAIVAKDKKHQELLEGRVEKLSDELTGLEMAIQALKEENQNLQTRLESNDKKYQDISVARDVEFSAFLERKIKELSEERMKSLGSLVEEKSLVNVGTVDMQRVIEESKKGREARMFFEGLTSLRSEEELTKTERKLVSEIVKDIEVVVQQYAKEHGIIYVVDGVSGELVHINKRLDITDEIIGLYNEMVETLKQEEVTIK